MSFSYYYYSDKIPPKTPPSMRRSKIVPASPTGFPREQDLMFPFPQKEEKESTKNDKNTRAKDVLRQTIDDHTMPTTITPPPLLNGHNTQNGANIITNGCLNDDKDEIPETTSPPLPLPPTPEPSSQVLPSTVNGVKSPPPPSPPIPLMQTGEQSTHRQFEEPIHSVKESKEDKEEQKVRYYIIPSPAPSSPRQQKEVSPPQRKGINIEISECVFK